MYCQKCGRENKEEEATFCSNCGASLKGTMVPPAQQIKEKRSGSKLSKTLKILGIIVLALIIIGAVMIFVFLGAVGSHAAQTANVQSATILVTCSGCSSGIIGSSQFSGAVDNNNAQVTLDGNNSLSYHVSRDGNSFWVFSWTFQKSTSDGTLDIRVTLDNGQVAFDNSTSAAYGVVSGSWSG